MNKKSYLSIVGAIVFLTFPPVSQLVRIVFASLYMILPFVFITLIIALEEQKRLKREQVFAANIQLALVASFMALLIYRLLYSLGGKEAISFFIFFPFAVIGSLIPHLIFAYFSTHIHAPKELS